MAEPKIVEAVGSTKKPEGMGAAIEEAMGNAQAEAAKETEAIWANEKLSAEDKQKQIAAIMDPKAILERKMAARAKVRKEYSDAEAKSTTGAVDKIAADAKAGLKK